MIFIHTYYIPLDKSVLYGIILSQADVLNVLKFLNKEKASGTDNNPAVYWNQCCNEPSASLCPQFNISLASGYIPFDWRSANVVPIIKAGDREHIQNYHPISVIGSIYKITAQSR